MNFKSYVFCLAWALSSCGLHASLSPRNELSDRLLEFKRDRLTSSPSSSKCDHHDTLSLWSVYSKYAEPIPKKETSQIDYVLNPLKKASQSVKDWLTSLRSPSLEDDYRQYQDLSKFVELHASTAAMKKLAQSILQSQPGVSIWAGDHEMCRSDVISTLRREITDALVALEDDRLTVPERYWALGIFACLRNQLQQSGLDRDDPYIGDAPKISYRGQLEYYLMGGMFY